VNSVIAYNLVRFAIGKIYFLISCGLVDFLLWFSLDLDTMSQSRLLGFWPHKFHFCSSPVGVYLSML
jgi:hypothetical protein